MPAVRRQFGASKEHTLPSRSDASRGLEPARHAAAHSLGHRPCAGPCVEAPSGLHCCSVRAALRRTRPLSGLPSDIVQVGPAGIASDATSRLSFAVLDLQTDCYPVAAITSQRSGRPADCRHARRGARFQLGELLAGTCHGQSPGVDATQARSEGRWGERGCRGEQRRRDLERHRGIGLAQSFALEAAAQLPTTFRHIG
jgi:hypothetical protein